MRNIILLLLLLTACYGCRQPETSDKYRVVILTDQTHDDGNSLIRYLYYSHLFDTEAIIVTPQLPDYNYNDDGPWNKAQSIISAYRDEYPQLIKHQPELIEPGRLKEITQKGRGALPIIWLTNTGKFSGEIAGRFVESQWGPIRFHDWIGEGLNPNGEPKDSEGSEFLQEVFARADNRPIFVECWGGPVTLVQALYRFRQRQGEEKFRNLLAKLHIFSIHLQDITFDYFLNLDDLRETGCLNMDTVRSTFTDERVQPGWFLFDHGHFWKYITVMKQAEVNGNGRLSDLYDHGGEGDTPAFLYLVSAALGLHDPLEPTQGSWASRFVPMKEPFPGNYFSTCGVDAQELGQWIPDAKNSFLNRLQWSVKEPGQVNREPVAAFGRDQSNKIVKIIARPGKKITLDASASSDPDGDQLTFRWFHFKNAGSYSGNQEITPFGSAKLQFRVPGDLGTNDIHIILEVRDNGTPPLVSYKRVIITAGNNL